MYTLHVCIIIPHRLVINTYLKINNRIRYDYVSFIHGYHSYPSMTQESGRRSQGSCGE